MIQHYTEDIAAAGAKEDTKIRKMTMMRDASKVDPPSDNEDANSILAISESNSGNSRDINQRRSRDPSLDGGSVHTSSTQESRSLCGGSQSVASTSHTSDPDIVDNHLRRISQSGEARIEQVLTKKFGVMHQTNDGLEKLGAYVLGEEENDILNTNSASPSLSNRSHEEYDDEISLELSSSPSSPSAGTAPSSSFSSPKGSTLEQMKLWIREVNIAVGREPPPALHALQDETTEEDKNPPENVSEEEIPSKIPEPESPPVSLPETPAPEEVLEPESPIFESENATTDTMRLALLLQSQQENDTFTFTPSPRQKNQATPLSRIFVDNTQDEDGALFAGWDDNKPLTNATHFCPEFSLEIKPKINLDKPKTEDKHQEETSTIVSSTTTKTKYRRNNSKLIMASIEGKYRNLREHLTTESGEEIESEEEEEEQEELEEEALEKSRCRLYPGRSSFVNNATNTLGSPVRKMVSVVMESRDALREEYHARDHFSLGMLSMQSSGILRSNSWSTTDSYETEKSGKYQAKSKGCGIFLCD